ncbi:hypothetical protein RRG08_056041 [Elysia crispata]|uniref:Uncharacterized protein n=1 Tax=Elysia crispata TaxID=231223 RepID=A0AAE1DY39_9GAST|nr:hypothetical protein RRG08_056041 [Elysia crispata]
MSFLNQVPVFMPYNGSSSSPYLQLPLETLYGLLPLETQRLDMPGSSIEDRDKQGWGWGRWDRRDSER